MRTFAYLFIALLSISFVFASQSAEPVLVRVTSFDEATRAYTFTCTIPAGTSATRYWTVRPDTPALEYSISTTSPTLQYNLTKDVMYHVGCQVINLTDGKPVRGDYHIDRRTAPNTIFPNVKVTQAKGLNVSFHCDPQNGTKNYNLYWTIANPRRTTTLPQFNNMRDINLVMPYPLLWDIDCGIWDLDNQTWKSWGYPVEFLASGEVYLPNTNGCIPGDFCPWNSTNQTNTTIPPNTTNQTIVQNGTCYDTIQFMPVSCTGTITNDTYNGCRKITCTNLSSSIQVQACPKGAYFEMYKQSSVGAMKLCIGSTCISESGYAKSGNFPICIGNTNQTNTTVPATNATNQTCHNTIQFMPVNCTGTITNDTYNGCRKITCSNSSNTMQVQACPKGAYFEMYKQNGNGLQICIGTTCISENGYAKSGSFPICSGPGNTTNSTPVNNTTKPLEQFTYVVPSFVHIGDSVSPPSISPDTLTQAELIGLHGGTAGGTPYFTYLRFRDGGNSTTGLISSPYLNNSGTPTMYIDNVNPFMEWEIQFPQGLESPVQNGDMPTLNNQHFNILGREFTIINANLDFGDDVQLTLMNGTAGTLHEGETQTYSFKNTNYETTLIFVSDPNNGTPSVKFSVNGEITPSLRKGRAYRLANGYEIGVRDVQVNAIEGIASFIIGDKIAIFDENATSANSFVNSVGINDYTVDADVAVLGANTSSTTFEITSIKYRFKAGHPIVMSQGQTLKKILDKPYSLISDTLDIQYTGGQNITVFLPAQNTSQTSVSIGIAPWFPQGKSYVFVCNATGFAPTFYDFSFGDGETNNWRTTSDVYYKYNASGSYNVTCAARNATYQQSATLAITVA